MYVEISNILMDSIKYTQIHLYTNTTIYSVTMTSGDLMQNQKSVFHPKEKPLAAVKTLEMVLSFFG